MLAFRTCDVWPRYENATKSRVDHVASLSVKPSRAWLAELISAWRPGGADAPVGYADFVQALKDEPRYAAAYEALFSSLELLARARQPMSVLVTSAGPREGKSSVVANLALVMGAAGRRVLAIDADLRRPSLHENLNLPNRSGLSELLLGQAEPLAVLQRASANGFSGAGVSLVSAGAAPEAALAIPTPRLASALQALSGGFDFVLLDSPPVLAVNDAAALAACVDGVLLAIRAGTTSEEDLRRAKQRIEQAGGRILGSVLTRYDGTGGSHPYPYADRSHE